jgi:hypothetical protein
VSSTGVGLSNLNLPLQVLDGYIIDAFRYRASHIFSHYCYGLSHRVLCTFYMGTDAIQDILPTLCDEGKWLSPPHGFQHSRNPDAKCFCVSGAGSSINAHGAAPYLDTWDPKVGVTRAHAVATTRILKARIHSLQLRHPNGSGKAASVVEEDDVTGVCFAPLCTPPLLTGPFIHRY